ncbi:MAG: GLUG motif-containing protein [Halobacteriales archaeon]|nr:GLUG motif-containing protein [Halobacteriales archaeon]
MAGWIEDDTTVSNSYAEGDVYSEFCCSGGFAGWVYYGAEVHDSYATGDVTELGCCGGGFLGGIWDGSVTGSFSTGDVQGEDEYIGGFAGDIDNEGSGVVSRNIATGDVTASNGVWVGGFAGSIGELYTSNVTESAATGNVESTDDIVGGFVGNMEKGEVNKSYARGDVTGNDTVGGFAGLIQDGTIDETYSVGVPTATGAGATDVGGFVGRDDTTVTTGISSTSSETNERGIGDNADFPGSTDRPPIPKQRKTVTTRITDTGTTIQANGPITDSYWDEEASGTSDSDGGAPLSTSQMTGSNAPTNMLGFDFTSTWETVRNDYPILQNSPDLSILDDSCTPRRSLSRGQEDNECPHDRELRRGQTRGDIDRGFDRGTSRRDRGRDSTRRDRSR